ncbi:glycoside hydrolase superfamily [Aspergillus spectabilis]
MNWCLNETSDTYNFSCFSSTPPMIPDTTFFAPQLENSNHFVLTMDTPDIQTLLSKLTIEEKVSLLSAVDWWRTPVIKREDVFVPHIKSTDGPNGARGESYVSGIKAACFPCGTSLGASFDRDLLFRTGQEIAKEAQTKAANILLAPTLDVIRSPRGRSAP